MSKAKNYIIALIVLGSLLFVLFLIRSKVEEKQEIRSKAAGSGKIAISLSPATSTLQPNGTLNVNMVLANTTTAENFQLNTAGVDLQFDPNIFSITNIVCNSGFLANVAKNSIEGNKMFLTCMAPGGNMMPINAGQQKTLGSFTITVNAAAVAGQSAISFVRTFIPNAGDETYTDLSNAGASGTYTISGAGGATLTPTATPPAGQATATPTVTPPATPTQQPNTFNTMIDFKLKGVEPTGNDTINSYREGANGTVAITYRLYSKVNPQDFVEFTEGSASYSRTNTAYRIYMNNIPNSLKTNSILLVKANKHLRAKFCSNNQTQRCVSDAESTGLNFSSNASSYNFGTYPLLPGDVDQNGVLNGTDLILMMRELAVDPPTRSLRYDLNYDGIVTGVDYQLMQDSMTVFDDE